MTRLHLHLPRPLCRLGESGRWGSLALVALLAAATGCVKKKPQGPKPKGKKRA